MKVISDRLLLTERKILVCRSFKCHSTRRKEGKRMLISSAHWAFTSLEISFQSVLLGFSELGYRGNNYVLFGFASLNASKNQAWTRAAFFFFSVASQSLFSTGGFVHLEKAMCSWEKILLVHSHTSIAQNRDQGCTYLIACRLIENAVKTVRFKNSGVRLSEKV